MKFNLIRPMFCSRCYEQGRPRLGDRFVIKHKSGALTVFQVYGYPDFHNRGITPHYINEANLHDDQMGVSHFCLMEDCGVKIADSKEVNKFMVSFTIQEHTYLALNNWNALRRFPLREYSLI